MIYYILYNTSLTASEAVIHFLITIFVYLISITVHEFAHAFVAYKCGDSTAKLAGRMTLNPLKHLSFMGFIMFVFLGFGWAKPVPTNPLNYKKYKKGTRAVSLAGVASNFLLGVIAAVAIAVIYATVGISSVAIGYLYYILLYFMLVNSFLVMFNILPIPPMDGFNFIATFCKEDSKFLRFVTKNAMKLILGFLILGLLTDLFFGFDIFSEYLELLFNFVYTPITWLGVL